MEYASSPVAQPGAQTRTCSPGPLRSNMRGTTAASRRRKASGSRKKFVTLMSRSRRSPCNSSGRLRTCARYAGRSSDSVTCKRRSMRRSMVERL